MVVCVGRTKGDEPDVELVGEPAVELVGEPGGEPAVAWEGEPGGEPVVELVGRLVAFCEGRKLGVPLVVEAVERLSLPQEVQTELLLVITAPQKRQYLGVLPPTLAPQEVQNFTPSGKLAPHFLHLIKLRNHKAYLPWARLVLDKTGL